MSAHISMLQQATEDLRNRGSISVLGDDPVGAGEEVKQVAAEIVAAVHRKIAQIQADPAAALRDFAPQLEGAQHEPVDTIDNLPVEEEDAAMSATTDKDYIDARLSAISAATDARIELAAAKMDARFDANEARIDGRLASIEQLVSKKFAEFDATLHKSTADTVKWVAGTVMALGVIGISIMTFLFNNLTPKASASPPAPIVIYSQPAPVVAPPSASQPAAPAAKP